MNTFLGFYLNIFDISLQICTWQLTVCYFWLFLYIGIYIDLIRGNWEFVGSLELTDKFVDVEETLTNYQVSKNYFILLY